MNDELLVTKNTANYMGTIYALHCGSLTFVDFDDVERPLDMQLVEKVENRLSLEWFDVDDFRLTICAWLGHCSLKHEDHTHHIGVRKAVAAMLGKENGRAFAFTWSEPEQEADKPEVVLI